ncbi:MAG: ribonuclease D [Ilumatobacteraceae bacterium]
MSRLWVEDNDTLDAVVEELISVERYAIDTEFHREKTYYPQLALVQISWHNRIALIDPLAIDMRRMARLFESNALAVVHAAQQDLEVLEHSCGVAPRRIFDTQLSAGFLGYSTPSLSSVVQCEFKVVLPKADRLTDWLRRPLSEAQIRYAASDVEYLLGLHDRLAERLNAQGRQEWANQACEELRTRPHGPADPTLSWLKIKEVRALRGSARGVAQSVAEWRERKAMAADVPPRRVLSDMALLVIAQKMPNTEAELVQSRGIEARQIGGTVAHELLDAVRQGVTRHQPAPVNDSDDVDRDLRPAVTLISAWVSELARQHRIDVALLATRSDITALLREQPEARLAQGWRAHIVGDDIKRIVSGHAGLGFDSKGGLRLLDTDPVAREAIDGHQNGE